MENVLNKSNVELINNDPEKLLKLIKEPNFEHIHKISDKQVLVQSKPVKTIFNKPIYLGSVILETSKLHIFSHTICFSDTFDFLSLLISQALLHTDKRKRKKNEKSFILHRFLYYFVFHILLDCLQFLV